MAYTKLIPRSTPGAQVEEIEAGKEYRLSIPSGPGTQYRLAQLDDYTKLKRNQFPLHPPLQLNLSARVSHRSIPGTWGFGLWNDPFGLSLGFGGNPWRLPTLPNAVWFFGASEESYLSFAEPRAERNAVKTKRGMQSNSQHEQGDLETNRTSSAWRHKRHSAQRELVANGFLAQVFRSPRFHPSLIPAGLALPFSRRTTRRLLGRVIEEEGVQLWSPMARHRDLQERTCPGGRRQGAPALQTVTEWHHYRLDWRENGVSFEVDDSQVFESQVSPKAPLGLVIWIDNQYAAFTPEGKIGFGVLENPEPAWLEIKGIDVR